MTDPRFLGQLAREAGAVIGGRLYSDSLSGPAGPAPTYVDTFHHNVGEITKVLWTEQKALGTASRSA